ncbi:MAG TPA: DUF72 domain-containing protein [Micromonosporaceae bacterium]|nr:DUF72 domain-containing protein [Micromonosporaceae bacterium]
MIYVGTSGWMYDDWRGRFYPADVPRKAWLEFYAGAFATVEINNAFYRLPGRDTFEAWHSRVGGDFRFAVKMSRYLSHIKRLRDPVEPVARFMSRATGLGDRLGPLLLQLPPTMRRDAGLLDATLAEVPAGTRVAVEPRHPSWWHGDVRGVLESRGAALVWADRRGRPVTPLWVTAGWGYVRLHEGRARPWPGYGRAALDSWVHRIGAFGGGDVYVYFNNDPGGAAVRDAVAFTRLATAKGLPVSRVTGAVRQPCPATATSGGSGSRRSG